jgi:hypothetical protein
MAEKRDKFTYEDLKREPGNLIESRDWNTAMWAIEEVGTRLTTLGEAVPRKSGANTLTGPLTIEDALTVGRNHVVIRGNGTTGPETTLEVAEAVKVGTDATITGTLTVSKGAEITGKTTITGTLTVTEQVRLQKNAIPEGTNDCQLEIFSPNTGKAQDYTKIRFHQANQYYAWLGYHGLSSANQAGEFVFFDLNAKKEAHVRTGALTCTGDASLGGSLEVAHTLTVKGSSEFTKVVTAQDVHLDGTSVAEMLRNLSETRESHIVWKTVVYQFQPNATNVEVSPDRQTINIHGLTVPHVPGMPLAKEQILSLRGVVEIPIQLIPPADGNMVLLNERIICEVGLMSLEPVFAWPQPQDTAQNWCIRARDIVAPPWVRGDQEIVEELQRREAAKRLVMADIEEKRRDAHNEYAQEIRRKKDEANAKIQESKKKSVGDWLLQQVQATPGEWRGAYADQANGAYWNQPPDAPRAARIRELWIDDVLQKIEGNRSRITQYPNMSVSITSYEPVVDGVAYRWMPFRGNETPGLYGRDIQNFIGQFEVVERQVQGQLETQDAALIATRDATLHQQVLRETQGQAMSALLRRDWSRSLDEIVAKFNNAPGTTLTHILSAQPCTVPVSACVEGLAEPAPWTLRLLITYSIRMGHSPDVPPVATLRGLPTRVPMRLTA